MRVLNIMLARQRGGVETMAVRYHQALAQGGFEVLSAGHPEGMLTEALDANAVRPLSAYLNYDPIAALSLGMLARWFKPDLVLAHGNRAAGIALMPLSGVAARTVQVVHNFRHKPDVNRLRAAIAVSGPIHASLRNQFPDLAVFEVDNFAALSPHPVKPAPEGVPVLGTLGRLHVNKGLDVVLQALARLRDDGVAVRLKIAGDGPIKDELVHLATALGLNHQVEFCGWMTPAGDYLRGLDLFLCPSRVEPFGLVVIESMAAGVPVVASDIDGPRQSLHEGRFGYLCAREDPAAMADAIKQAIADWPGTLAKAHGARDFALSHFSLEAGTARLSEAVQQIAACAAKKT
jgi:glycosyltransferase involved in cell wall biosynthesis